MGHFALKVLIAHGLQPLWVAIALLITSQVVPGCQVAWPAGAGLALGLALGQVVLSWALLPRLLGVWISLLGVSTTWLGRLAQVGRFWLSALLAHGLTYLWLLVGLGLGDRLSDQIQIDRPGTLLLSALALQWLAEGLRKSCCGPLQELHLPVWRALLGVIASGVAWILVPLAIVGFAQKAAPGLLFVQSPLEWPLECLGITALFYAVYGAITTISALLFPLLETTWKTLFGDEMFKRDGPMVWMGALLLPLGLGLQLAYLALAASWVEGFRLVSWVSVGLVAAGILCGGLLGGWLVMAVAPSQPTPNED